LQQDDGSFKWNENSSKNPEWMTSYIIPALLGKHYPVKILDKNIFNRSPEKPDIISGPNTGNTGYSYKYFIRTTDPDNDKIQYRFDWDSENSHDYSKWTTLTISGDSDSLSHKWEKPGNYILRAQAKDELGKTSSWSSGFRVQIVDEIEYWTGSIRIEGINNTILDNIVTVGDIYISAINEDTGKTEIHHISYPTILGALNI